MRTTRQLSIWFTAGGAIALALAVAPGCRPTAHAPEAAHHEDHDHGPGHDHDHAAEHASDHDHNHDPSADHSPEKHMLPADYRQAVAQIRAGADRIANAMGAGDWEAAHDPLDQIDPIIGQLMPIAKQSGVPRKDWESVNVARRELRAEFDKLHAQIDAGETPNYAAARSTIEDRLNRLQAVADQLDRQPSAPPAPANAATSEEPTP
jgi:hypothetical protein